MHLRVEWQDAEYNPFITELSINDFELLPHEYRELDVEWRSKRPLLAGNGRLIVNATNAKAADLIF